MDSQQKYRPVPVIENEISFSRKKNKSQTFTEISETPRSPTKSAPPISRVFRNRMSSTPGACAVSFRQSQIKREVNIQSPLYTNFNKLYFDQCFTRLSFLGSGSFGQVVKVQSREDGKLYAVKKSRERFRSDSDRKHQLEEVNKNEQIKVHPNCVRFYKAWEECDHLYIQTELCEMSLKDYAENVQVIEEREIWNIIVDLSHGLKHLHNANFAHMDIKPANLFLGRDGRYKIGDFGLVVELTRDLNDAMDGDSKYMAPELMEGKFSQAADIFSLGIAILELACSLELPHGGSLWHDLRNNKLPLEFTQGLSDDLIILVSNMMDRNPLNRPTVNDVINRPCVVQAKRSQRYEKSNLSYYFTPFSYLFGFLCQIFNLFVDLFKGFRWSRDRPKRSSSTFESVQRMEKLGLSNNNGHESLDVNISRRFSSVVLKNKENIQISPLLKDSPLTRGSPVMKESPLCCQPVSNKRELDMWKVCTPDITHAHHTPRNRSTPRPEDCSPSISPVSDRAVRSKLFNYSDDEEEDLHSLSVNLIKAFEESES